jgi:hypothetical protein
MWLLKLLHDQSQAQLMVILKVVLFFEGHESDKNWLIALLEISLMESSWSNK